MQPVTTHLTRLERSVTRLSLLAGAFCLYAFIAALSDLKFGWHLGFDGDAWDEAGIGFLIVLFVYVVSRAGVRFIASFYK